MLRPMPLLFDDIPKPGDTVTGVSRINGETYIGVFVDKMPHYSGSPVYRMRLSTGGICSLNPESVRVIQSC